MIKFFFFFQVDLMHPRIYFDFDLLKLSTDTCHVSVQSDEYKIN